MFIAAEKPKNDTVNREYFVRVGGLSVKIAAGISAVMSTIAYVPQMGSIVLSA